MQFNIDAEKATAAAGKIKLLLLDVDGVMTDGALYFSNSGGEMKCFNTLDGHGIKMFKQAGLEVGIITGRTSELVAHRAADLGIDLLYQGREDKLDVLEEILRERKLAASEVAYAGDDFPDLPVLLQVGLSFSVPGAHPEVKSRANAVTTAAAGRGAVREITDFILTSQGLYAPFLPS